METLSGLRFVHGYLSFELISGLIVFQPLREDESYHGKDCDLYVNTRNLFYFLLHQSLSRKIVMGEPGPSSAANIYFLSHISCLKEATLNSQRAQGTQTIRQKWSNWTP